MSRAWFAVMLTSAAHAALVVVPVTLNGPVQEPTREQIVLNMMLPPAPAVAHPTPKPKQQPLKTPRKTVVRKRHRPTGIQKEMTVSQIPSTPLVPQKVTEKKVEDAPKTVAEATKPVALPTPVVPEAQPKMVDMKAYGRTIHRAVMPFKRYPMSARRQRIEGKTLVKLILDRRGELSESPKVYRSSGFASLDRESLRIVQSAAPFAPLPEGFPRGQATIVIPIAFQLADS